MHWHIGMSSASCTGDHGGPRFKSWQGRVIFHHKFECKLTRRPYISAMPMLSEPSGHITNLSPNSNHITFTQLNVEKERKNNSKYLISPHRSLIRLVSLKSLGSILTVLLHGQAGTGLVLSNSVKLNVNHFITEYFQPKIKHVLFCLLNIHKN